MQSWRRSPPRSEDSTGSHVPLRQLGGHRIHLRDNEGQLSSVSLNVLDPHARRRISLESESGLGPVAVWLNDDGMPRAPHGWRHTFVGANTRVARADLVGLAGTARMLWHSFALRWFSVGRLLYEKRFAHLGGEDTHDFRAQLGDAGFACGHVRKQPCHSVPEEPSTRVQMRGLVLSVLTRTDESPPRGRHPRGRSTNA